MKRVKLMTCLLAGLLVWASVIPVEARRDERSSGSEATRRNGLTLYEAVARVRRDTGGRVLSAETVDYLSPTAFKARIFPFCLICRIINLVYRDDKG